MRKGFRRFAAAFLAGSMLLSVGGCASKATEESLRDELEELEEEYDELKDENRDLKNKLKELTGDDPDRSSSKRGSQKVGISLPTKDLKRWNFDGDRMKKELEAAGCDVDLQYASNDISTQVAQIDNMIQNGCDVLIITPIDGSALGTVLDKAVENNIPVISYDRLLIESDAVSYYVTFDNYDVGAIQARFILDELDVDNAKGTFNIELSAGDPGDNNAYMFYNGAFDMLKPYIDSGKLNVLSGQKEFDEVATPGWATDIAKQRATNIITGNYKRGTDIDAWLCSNDTTAAGVVEALEDSGYKGKYPVITGQDCDLINVRYMLAGKQAMSAFKDTRVLASRAVKMALQILGGETVEVNDTSTYNNNSIFVPTYLCKATYVDKNNYKEILIDSGYYLQDEIG